MDTQALMEWRGRDVIDRDGDKVGTFEDLYVDADSGRPEFGLVKTGLFGRRGSFVPLAEVTTEGGALRIPYDKDQIKDAPNVDPDADLSTSEEAELYRHYGLSPTDAVGQDESQPQDEAQASEPAQPSQPAQASQPAGGEQESQAAPGVGSHTRLRRYVVTEETRVEGQLVSEQVHDDG